MKVPLTLSLQMHSALWAQRVNCKVPMWLQQSYLPWMNFSCREPSLRIITLLTSVSLVITSYWFGKTSFLLSCRAFFAGLASVSSAGGNTNWTVWSFPLLFYLNNNRSNFSFWTSSQQADKMKITSICLRLCFSEWQPVITHSAWWKGENGQILE